MALARDIWHRAVARQGPVFLLMAHEPRLLHVAQRLRRVRQVGPMFHHYPVCPPPPEV